MITRPFSRKNIFLVLAFASLTYGTEAYAKDSGGILRAFGNLGFWGSTFNQKDNSGHSTRVLSLIGPGLQAQLGVNIGHFFLEYNFSWLFGNHYMNLATESSSTSPVVYDPRNVGYFSPIGFNLGINVPNLFFEPYAGVERAKYGFSQGVETTYFGVAAKLGTTIYFNDHIGLKAEYRHLFVSSDDAGTFPSGFSTRVDTASLMLTFGQR